MDNETKVLNKMEAWAERLPYQKLTVTIELSNKTLTLEKSKEHPVGFTARRGD